MQLAKIVSEAIMGATEYQPPAAGKELVADFYTLEAIKHGERHRETTHSELLQAEINNVEQKLLPYLRSHLLMMSGYSIACELRHCFDVGSPTLAALALVLHDESTSPELREITLEWIEIGKELGRNVSADTVKISLDVDQFDTRLVWQVILQIMRSLGLNEEWCSLYRQLINTMVPDSNHIDRPEPEVVYNMLADRGNIASLLRAGSTIFPEGTYFVWLHSFAGQPWVDACKGVYNLLRADTLGTIVTASDHIFDLQHNTGGLLDKNMAYAGIWFKRLLNIKRDAKSPEEIAKHASPYIRRLARFAVQERFGRGWQGAHHSRALDTDYRSALSAQFCEEAKSKGFIVSAMGNAISAISCSVYSPDSNPNIPNNLDRLGIVEFWPDHIGVLCQPQLWRPNSDTVMMNKSKGFDYSSQDFETVGFAEILKLLTKYPTGRAQRERTPQTSAQSDDDIWSIIH